jgi:hypothetical protein
VLLPSRRTTSQEEDDLDFLLNKSALVASNVFCVCYAKAPGKQTAASFHLNFFRVRELRFWNSFFNGFSLPITS